MKRWGWVERWGGLKVTKTVSIQIAELPFIEPQVSQSLAETYFLKLDN